MSLEQKIAFYELSEKLSKIFQMDKEILRNIIISTKIDIDKSKGLV
jgi:hypothetical protein